MSPRLGRRIAHFNRRVTNRVTGPLAPWLPGFGVVVHSGRKSGREYRTPVNVFRHGGGYVIALTYGAEADWVRNVLAAGRATLLTRGGRLELTGPELVHDESRGRESACGMSRRDNAAHPPGCSVMRSTVRMPTRS
jgi:deazaflavin-dependent oxidoreductase (nitroreductase family)